MKARSHRIRDRASEVFFRENDDETVLVVIERHVAIRDVFLSRSFRAWSGAIRVMRDVERVLVVDRHPELHSRRELAADQEDVGEEDRVALFPIVVLFAP